MSPIRQDKFGKPIYSKPFAEIVKNGKILNKNGYNESLNKPNLFYKKTSEVVFFADMRSSDVIPIWKDTRPLFYRTYLNEMPNWEKRRLLKQELQQLYKSGCECRLSFHTPHEWEEFETTNSYIDEEEVLYEWDDGFCLNCGKDFQDDGSFCCDECEWSYRCCYLPRCEICEQPLDWIESEEVWHHINYEKDITIKICKSCHGKIHHSKDQKYEKYKPVDTRTNLKDKRLYMYVPCAGGCGKNARILKDEYEPNKAYSCYKCNKDAERWISKLENERGKNMANKDILNGGKNMGNSFSCWYDGIMA